MKRHFSFLGPLLAALLLAGAGCSSDVKQPPTEALSQPSVGSGASSQAVSGVSETGSGQAGGNGSMMGNSDSMMADGSMVMGYQYTMDEVAKHDSASDCWVVVSGDVHDVTSYIPKHPGGDKILKGCGQDITAYFTSGHSAKGMEVIPQYKIGEISQ